LEKQAIIDEVLHTAKAIINHGFVASDGDSSENERHHALIEFSTACDQVLRRIPEYLKPLPLSDLLRLAIGSHLRVFGFDPPLTDLSQVGKMRNRYPLVIIAITKAVTFFPLKRFIIDSCSI
jgi:hypothetical protein